MKVLLDTNICIYLIKDKPAGVREWFKPFRPGDVGISSISAAELHYGVAKSKAIEKNSEALTSFLFPLEIVSFDDAAAIAYGGIRTYLEKKGSIIGSLDMLIAAQAVSLNITLITNNLREFKRVPGLKCENWI